MLQTLCFKVILKHAKKPQDEARNFEEDSRQAQGVLWESHVLEKCPWLQPGEFFAEE